VFEFVKCPCCAGHDVISDEAAAELEVLIDGAIARGIENTALETELYNIRNAIYNARTRKAAAEEPIDPLLE
jgi:hypothetical protein